MTYSLSVLFTASDRERRVKNDNFTTTYITISPKKDGRTAKTKCINPQNNNSTFLPLKRKLKVPSTNLTSIFPKLRILNSPLRDRRSSSVSCLSHLQSDIIQPTKFSMATLPNEVISQILFFLDFASIQMLSQTCHRIRSVCRDDDLWRKLFSADFQFITINHVSKKRRSEIPYHLALYKNHLALQQRWSTGKVTTRFLQGHEDSVYCSAWIGKNLLATGSRDQAVKIWDVSSGKCIRTLKDHHTGSILCMRVDRDTLMTGSSDATCILWSLPELEPKMHLRGHGHSVLDVCLVNNKIVTSSKDHTLRVWDYTTGNELRQLLGHTASVNALDSVSHNQVVSASGDTTLKLWNVDTGECLRTFEGHKLGLACVRFDGNYLYSGGLDGKINVWDIDTGGCVNTLIGHGRMIRSIDCLQVI
ncbi:hypothetical protein G6F54_006399 [Rhizopus delemar]|nr:hypothetical protein G6F54_006399 [Rhizopus delemar]